MSQQDPLGILLASHQVVLQATEVLLNFKALKKTAEIIKKQIDKGNVLTQAQFGVVDTTNNGVQLVFLEDTVNFCFWPDPGQKPWQIIDSTGKVRNGWTALTYCFQRALEKKIPFLSTDYLLNASLSDWQDFFRGENNILIPLFKQRVVNLREAGRVLNKKYQGHFKNVVRKADFNAINLVKILVSDFPSFRDIALFKGEKIPFLKRAQITAYDLSLMFNNQSWGKLTNLDKLTAFADYKLPQLLHFWGVLEYSTALREKISQRKLLRKGSRKELEIRAATIQAVELIRQNLGGKVTAPQIDSVIWKLSQTNQKKMAPYHLTRTVYY